MSERTIEMVLSLDVKPKGQGRPRFDPRSSRAYTPKNTREYVKMIRAAVEKYWGDRDKLNGAVAVAIEANFQLPKRTVRIFHTQRPDADNIAKACLDAMQGVIFGDDAQVIDLRSQKNWSVIGNQLSITVWSVAA